MESINRIKNKTENFTIVSNEIFKRNDISARAKGLYAYIMTLPDDWKIYKQEIFTHFSEGKNALDSAFKELEKLGYITKEKTKNEKGQFVGWDYTIYESATEDIETDRMENRVSDLPKSVNGQLLSTDINTNKEINKIIKKDIYSEVYAEIITYLNGKTSSRYRSTESTKKLIHARLEEGFTKEDFFTVIDNKVKTWKGTEWEKFLRPETLFCASKFQGYLNEKPAEKKPAKTASMRPDFSVIGNVGGEEKTF
jgi:uncharacterized phage protein (TIGR02220 family)